MLWLCFGLVLAWLVSLDWFGWFVFVGVLTLVCLVFCRYDCVWVLDLWLVWVYSTLVFVCLVWVLLVSWRFGFTWLLFRWLVCCCSVCCALILVATACCWFDCGVGVFGSLCCLVWVVCCCSRLCIDVLVWFNSVVVCSSYIVYVCGGVVWLVWCSVSYCMCDGFDVCVACWLDFWLVCGVLCVGCLFDFVLDGCACWFGLVW